MVGNNWALPDGWVLPGYEHVRELGSGAGGHVWLARHRVTGTPVAVKYLVPGLFAAGDFREAYRAEAQLLAELHSEHIARLYEYVEGPPGAAIVMEAVEGCSLRALMTREEATAAAAASPEAALCILKGSLLGLAAAHDAGVVHRDFKPANVLVTPDGVSKLVDFGIAARTGSAGAAAGTPSYMAPEQFHGAPASPSSDVYAATVTFFECVTGERPFPGTNAIELMAQHALGSIPDDLAPPPIRSLIRSGMAKDPRERPASAREFVSRLEAVAGAAYGPDWEQRGQHKLATLLALMPLLLLLRDAAPVVPSSTTAVATTVLGQEPFTITIPSLVPETETHHSGRRHGRMSRRGRHSTRVSVGAGVLGALGLCLVITGAAAAAYAAYRPSTATHTNSAALTSATTRVTANSTVPFTLTPMPSPDTSSASPSASPTSTPTSSQSTSAATSTSAVLAASTSASPSSTSSATTSATATPSKSPSASPSVAPTPEIRSVAVTQLICPSAYTLQATVKVASNGLGGTLTLDWYYESVTGAQEPVGTTTYDLAAGETSQTVSPPSENFRQYSDYSAWGVTVSSSPTSKVTQAQPITPDSADNCIPIS